MDVIQEVTLQKGTQKERGVPVGNTPTKQSKFLCAGFQWFKVLVISSKMSSKVYSLSGLNENRSEISWRIDHFFFYDYDWHNHHLIEYLIVLIASKMKEDYVLKGNFIYEFQPDSTDISNTFSAKGKRKRSENHKALKGKQAA